MPTRPTPALFALVTLAAGLAPAAEPENLRQAAEGVFVGALPEGDDQWAQLQALGVKTVVGVDGLPPDASAARRRGMRPVHVPFGYEGINPEAAAQLTRVAREAERPVYVYCHHGRHRGPAAAAVVCQAAGLLDKAQAKRLLEDAGTNPDYVGLWRDVAGYQPPGPGAELPPLVERSEVSPLRLAMGQLDRAWDATLEATDEATRHAAMVLTREALRESRRAAAETQPPPDDAAALLESFDAAQAAWKQVESTARPARFKLSSAAFTASCVECHKKHRDGE